MAASQDGPPTQSRDDDGAAAAPSSSSAAAAGPSADSSPSASILRFPRPSPGAPASASAASSISGSVSASNSNSAIDRSSLRRGAIPSSWTPANANASMTSIHSSSADVSDGGGTTASHLSRAKSISSVTSVTSTSSMEAVPFRNAPRGNIRGGYAWGSMVGTGTGGATATPSASAQGRVTMPTGPAATTPTIGQRDFEIGAQQAAAVAAAAAASPPSPSRLPGPSTPSPRTARQRGINPKASAAEEGWHYRNAPGLGGRLDGKPLPGSQRNLRELASAAANANATANANDDGSSPPKKPAHHVLRSKLAKSASKLGVKPLTVVGVGPSFQAQAQSQASSSSSSSNPAASGSVPLMGDGAPLRDPSLELFTPLKTSTATNAPLIVPKLSPAPGAGGTPFFFGHPENASPGDAGSALVAWPSPLLTPTRLGGEEGDAGGGGGIIARPGSRNANTNGSGNGQLLRPRKALSVQGPFPSSSSSPSAALEPPPARGGKRTSLTTTPTANAAGANKPPVASEFSPSSPSASGPGPTPAEQVMLEAQAGVAKLPEQGSGAMPGPNPDPVAGQGSEPASSDPEADADPDFDLPHVGPGEGKGTTHPPSPAAGRGGAQSDESIKSRQVADVEENNHDDGDDDDDETQMSALHAWRFDTAQAQAQGDNVGHDAPPSSSSSPPAPSAAATATPAPALPPSLRPRPPPIVRLESSATAASKALSDGSDATPPVPFKRPNPRVVAGKVSIPEIRPELIDGGQVAASTRVSEESVRGGEGGLEVPYKKKGKGHTLSVVSERSSERGTNASPPEGSERTTASPASASTSTSAVVSQSNTPVGKGTGTGTGILAASVSTTGSASPSQGQGQGQGQTHSHPAGSKSRGRDDFEFGDILGEGSYSTVMQAWDLLSSLAPGAPRPHPATSAATAMSGSGSRARASMLEGKKVYAVKVLDKVHILKERKQKYVAVEKEALSLLVRHPGVVTLYWTFQDRESLYFVLELAPNGELLTYIKQYGSFDVPTARYYAAQLVDVVAGMHEKGVVHRDLKPENVLLDSSMRIKVTDFGSAKILPKTSPAAPAQGESPTQPNPSHTTAPRPSSFVGTAEYVSPELLSSSLTGPASDFWALGCVIFQMLAGRPPFKASSEYQTFQKILKRDFEFPEGFDEQAKDLVERLLVLEPEGRLGVAGVKGHGFFEGTDWEGLWMGEAPEMKSGIRGPPAPPAAAAAVSAGVDGDDGDADRDEDDGDIFGQDGWASGDLADESDERATETSDVEMLAPASALSSPSADEAEAEADASSLSDSEQHPARRRGQSVGERTAERFAAIRRGSSMLKIGPGQGGAAPTSPQAVVSPGAGSTSSRARFTLGGGGGSGSSSSIDAAASRGTTTAAAAPAVATHHRATGSGSAGGSVGSTGSANLFPPVTGPGASASPTAALNWGALLLPSESLLYASLVIHKKTGTANLQSKRRMLLLTDFPRLLCVKEDAVSLTVKSEVLLAQPRARDRDRDTAAAAAYSSPNVMLSVEQKGARGFVVNTPGKMHHYDDPSGDASSWVKSIRRAAGAGASVGSSGNGNGAAK
ncbi:hypothetical protein BDZ90DRAFT_233029 [Jaminaea rosea]|uniref:non-specific serine/threonine protein kinase n=1 Tax=Jaminaea rosea TaxID=1569628 RepID=A0A316UNT2_9BASI|nr:hypothetical protein BDZ90DRAFT_233029 [Jaminaea rosea]PWN26947.1 hypothetical protein BDZ90DRAFT_233029 [Jaminaea rosea]